VVSVQHLKTAPEEVAEAAAVVAVVCSPEQSR
jgi:hypothetical protein